jgi:hypothetical protein
LPVIWNGLIFAIWDGVITSPIRYVPFCAEDVYGCGLQETAPTTNTAETAAAITPRTPRFARNIAAHLVEQDLGGSTALVVETAGCSRT